MSTKNEITAYSRVTGRGNSRGLRKDKLIPAVIYGPKTENINLSIGQNEAVKYTGYGFENTIFTFKSDDKKINNIKVLVKDVDKHGLTHLPVHIDFYSPDMTQTVKVNVEVRFEGKAAGLAEGGLFNITKRDIEVECLPNEIPEFLTVDVSGLALNQSLHVSDAVIPEGVKLITSSTEAIANCTLLAEEAEPVAAEVDAAAPAEGAAPADAGKAEEPKK